jgi:sirohydrochlorin ferrochelatase
MTRLLLAAHGTRSPAGRATTARLVEAVAAARAGLAVSVGFLDVARPTLGEALAASDEPTIVVPVLLSAGYHVQADIPATVAGRSDVRVTRHLGPDPAIIEAVLDRLRAARGEAEPATTLLARVGSGRAAAAREFDAARAQLAVRLGRPESVLPPAGAVRVELARLAGPVEIATYLLAEGEFFSALQRDAAGRAIVAEPIGAHPALVGLILDRFDEVR